MFITKSLFLMTTVIYFINAAAASNDYKELFGKYELKESKYSNKPREYMEEFGPCPPTLQLNEFTHDGMIGTATDHMSYYFSYINQGKKCEKDSSGILSFSPFGSVNCYQNIYVNNQLTHRECEGNFFQFPCRFSKTPQAKIARQENGDFTLSGKIVNPNTNAGMKFECQYKTILAK